MVLLRTVIYATTAVLGRAHAHRRDDRLARPDPARAPDRPPGCRPSLRVVLLGGAPADPALLVRAREAGWRVAPTYGLTETCSAVTVAEPGDTETAGDPLPGYTVAIASDGAIVVDGDPAHRRRRRLDERGRLLVLGRKVDTIVTGGENVMPTEVEAVLLAHPAVADAAVVGRPDPEWGEAVTALVVPRAGTRSRRAARVRRAAPRAASRSRRRSSRWTACRATPPGKLLRRELD